MCFSFDIVNTSTSSVSMCKTITCCIHTLAELPSNQEREIYMAPHLTSLEKSQCTACVKRVFYISLIMFFEHLTVIKCFY